MQLWSDRLLFQKADFERILPECVVAVRETMELHAVTMDDEGVRNDWRLLNKLIPDNFVSMCLTELSSPINTLLQE